MSRKAKHNWHEHIATWLADVMRDEPSRLSDIAKLTEAAPDHLQAKFSWAPNAKTLRNRLVKTLRRQRE